MYQNRYSGSALPVLHVRFYRALSGREPVRDWLLELPKAQRREIGHDLKTVQFGWPLGMPLVRKLQKDLWEARSTVAGGIARVLFTVVSTEMILLHGFIKSSRRTPLPDLATARQRLKDVHGARHGA